MVTLPGQIGSVAQVAAGGNHSLFVTSSGQLYAVGHNYWGQLGNATNNATNNPNPTATLVTLPGQIGPVAQAAAGEGHSLVLTSSGQLYAFGENADGRLGNTTNINTTMPNPTPTLVPLPGLVGTVTQVAAGGYHSLVASSSGQLYAFGFNYYGQLGNATNTGMVTPNPTPTLVTLPGQAGTIADIAAGQHYSLVLTTSGQLYAFGSNVYGELSDATNMGTGNSNPVPALVTLPGQIGRDLAHRSRPDHSLATTASGQLYAFGINE